MREQAVFVVHCNEIPGIQISNNDEASRDVNRPSRRQKRPTQPRFCLELWVFCHQGYPTHSSCFCWLAFSNMDGTHLVYLCLPSLLVLFFTSGCISVVFCCVLDCCHSKILLPLQLMRLLLWLSIFSILFYCKVQSNALSITLRANRHLRRGSLGNSTDLKRSGSWIIDSPSGCTGAVME